MELNIEDLRQICCLENIEITLHAAKCLEQRWLRIADIISCIQNGKIIEQYPTDYPYPSCLILGLSVKTQYLHVVVGSNLETLWLITAYYPDAQKWKLISRQDNGCYIIIKNVPCTKCTQCGEEYLNGTTLQNIEHILETLKTCSQRLQL